MKTGRILCVVAIVAAGLAVAGCPVDIPAAVIIGNLGLDISTAGPAHGGTAYHVLLFAPGAVVDPGNLANPAPVVSMTGTLPGDAGDNYNTIPYFFPEVPEGEYFMFANPVYIEDQQPTYPNVPVPATGILDLDFNLTVYVT
jgi:hypothetical protein